MKKGAFDRYNIYNVQANHGGVKTARKIKGIRLSIARVLGSIDADEDFFDHCGVLPTDGDNMARGIITRLYSMQPQALASKSSTLI